MLADSNEKQTTGNDLDRLSLTERARILIVDDDADYIGMIKLILRQADFDVSSATGLHAALQKCAEMKPNLILLDIMMPELDGYDVFLRLRQVTAAPIIFVSAAPRDENLARSLDLGADDYISKPFHNQEVIARIQKVLRQRQLESRGQQFDFPGIGLHIEMETHEVLLRGKPLHLLPREFSLLKVLAERAPRNVLYETLVVQLWGEDNKQNRAHLKTVAFSLRRKLEAAAPGSDLLANHRGIGYQLVTNLSI